MTELHYIGEELELFREAVNWKRYFAGKLKPRIRGRVLEAGAGLGETTPYLLHAGIRNWTCLEPDPELYKTLQEKIRSGALPPVCTAVQGTLADLPAAERFDTILYIDVLEHIEDDRGEMERAAARLAPGGQLIVLSPAHQGLYSRFDKAIGHYRRYSKATLQEAGRVPGLKASALFLLESVGTLLLLVNKALARKSYPSRKTVRFWDRFVVPLSRVTDKLLFHSFGKTIIGIWTRE